MSDLKKPPTKVPDKEKRSREFITPTELDLILDASKTTGRYKVRDSCLISLIYNHALRVSETTRLKWSDVDFKNRWLLVRRSKSSVECKHKLNYLEIQQIKQLQDLYPKSKYLFCSERQALLTNRAVHSIIAKAGSNANLGMTIHPQMLCNGRIYQLISEEWPLERIQRFLGHKTDKIVRKFEQDIAYYLSFVKKFPTYLDKRVPVIDFESAQEAFKPDNDTEYSITVEVPASTCNLGPGLDTIGLALSLYSRVTFQLMKREIEKPDRLVQLKGDINKRSEIADQSNLIYAILSKLWKYEPALLNRVRITVDSDIPLGRGLGGTETAVLGAVWAAHIFQGKLPSLNQLLKECTYIEGQPESIAASLTGGMTIYGGSDEEYPDLVHNIDWPDEWKVIIVTPAYSLKTSDLRKILPKSYSRADAIHNIQRTALLVSAVQNRDEELLQHAMNDRLHEKYRCKYVPELAQIRELLSDSPILGCVLSGAGSSVAVFTNQSKKQLILDKLSNSFSEKDYRILDLSVPKIGMRELIHN